MILEKGPKALADALEEANRQNAKLTREAAHWHSTAGQLNVKLARVVEALELVVAKSWARELDPACCRVCAQSEGEPHRERCWIGVAEAALAAAQADAGPKPHPFEPCLKDGEPGHNFTCALLCTICGLPQDKHA